MRCNAGATKMKITQHTNYAIRMLMYCNSKSGLATIGEIAGFYNLSEKFLTKILSSLIRCGFVETVRGRKGGIRLARPAEEIFIGDVIQKIEENFELAECFKPGETSCPLVNSCGLSLALSRALQGFFDILNEYTLADLTNRKTALHNLMFESTLTGAH